MKPVDNIGRLFSTYNTRYFVLNLNTLDFYYCKQQVYKLKDVKQLYLHVNSAHNSFSLSAKSSGRALPRLPVQQIFNLVPNHVHSCVRSSLFWRPTFAVCRSGRHLMVHIATRPSANKIIICNIRQEFIDIKNEPHAPIQNKTFGESYTFGITFYKKDRYITLLFEDYVTYEKWVLAFHAIRVNYY